MNGDPFVCRTERDPTAGKGREREGVFSIAPVERGEWKGRERERERGRNRDGQR